MKICSTCKVEKPFEEFSKNRSRKDGYNNQCKSCDKQYYEENKDKKCEYQKRYQKENKDKVKQYYEENKDEISEYQKIYRKENKDNIKKYYEENKDKISEYHKQYYEENKDKIFEYQKRYQKENKDKVNAKGSKYRAKKLQATPVWLTTEHLKSIERFYSISLEMELIYGVKYHVDHIIPLQGDDVCGLHVPWNLQIVESKVNLKKGNKFFQDEEEFEVFMQMIEEEVLMEKEGNFQKSVDTGILSEYNAHIDKHCRTSVEFL